jgi:hypothetical protein
MIMLDNVHVTVVPVEVNVGPDLAESPKKG